MIWSPEKHSKIWWLNACHWNHLADIEQTFTSAEANLLFTYGVHHFSFLDVREPGAFFKNYSYAKYDKLVNPEIQLINLN